jgi:HEAT repeat protein
MRTREETLANALQSPDPAERIRAVQAACRDRRVELVPDLIALLSDEHAGYFAEECLPQFGDAVREPLLALVADESQPAQTRVRAAGVLALFGEHAAVPMLLEAIADPDVNGAYLQRLSALAPESLSARITQILQARRDEIATTDDPHRAAYFAALIRALGQAGNAPETRQTLRALQHTDSDWRIQDAVSAALTTR